MKRILTISLIFYLLANAAAQEKSYKEYVHHVIKGRQAERVKDFKTALDHFLKVTKITPYDPKRYYEISRLQVMLNQKDKAVENLTRSLRLGYDSGNTMDSVFWNLENHSQFSKIKILLDQIRKPVSSSTPAFTIAEKDLIPEGMTYDPVEECFYFGSIWKCKIIKVDKYGNVSDFTKEKQDGLRVVLGMEIDPVRRELWVASAVGSARPDIPASEMGWSGLFRYNIESGQLTGKYTIQEKDVLHFFNDMTITPAGDVFVTDTYDGSIYTVNASKDTLELYLKDDSFIYLNGICLNNNGDKLYVSSSGDGVLKIDIETSKHFLLTHPEDISLYGIDGMYFYKNSLICMQNGLQRVSRFYLNEKGNKVLGMKIIESRNPRFNWPTTGAIVDDSFYYIANSQIRSFNPDGSVFPSEKLKEVIILYTDLKK